MEFKKPEMEIVKISTEDVVTVSTGPIVGPKG